MTGGRNTPPLGYKSGVIVARMPFKHEALGRNQPFILTSYNNFNEYPHFAHLLPYK